MLTLYDFPYSPHCLRVRLALELAGARYRKIVMKLDGDQRRPSFRTLSPLGTVPVLVDGTTAVPESYAAILWLAERHRELLPVARAPRARTLLWVAAAATELDPPVRRAYDEAFFTERPSRIRVGAALDEVRAILDRLEDARRARSRDRFAAGGAPTLADAALFPSFWLLRDLADDFPRKIRLARWPFWTEWYERMCARSDVAAALAGTD